MLRKAYGTKLKGVRSTACGEKALKKKTPYAARLTKKGAVQLAHDEKKSSVPRTPYTVRIYFVGSANDQLGQRVFDVRLQGKTVDRKVDVIGRAGAARRALKLEYHDVPVDRDLVIQLAPHGTSIDQLPTACAVEVLRTGSEEIRRTIAQASIGDR